VLLTCSYEVLLQHLQEGLQQRRLQHSVGDDQGGNTKASLQHNIRLPGESHIANSSYRRTALSAALMLLLH
jgi:hypothetical protein